MSEYVVPDGPVGADAVSVGHAGRDVQERVLLDALAEAGIELGDGDRRIVEWLAGCEWSTVAVVASWVQRAVAARPSRAEVLNDAADRIAARAAQMGAVWLRADQVCDALRRLGTEPAPVDDAERGGGRG